MPAGVEQSPNVLLVVLDGVRAANCSLYGHDNHTTPGLEGLGDATTVYTQARAPGPESLSSHASIFTGLSPREHGVTDRSHRLVGGHTVWEWLADRGYRTGVFSNNPFLTQLPVGLQDAFETVVGRRQAQPFPDAVDPAHFVVDAPDAGPGKYLAFLRAAVENGRPVRSLANGVGFKFGGRREPLLPDALRPDASAERYADAFRSWRGGQDGPWAACLNLMDAHYPYEPGADHDRWGGERLRALQDAIDDQDWPFLAGERPWGERRATEALYDGAIHRMDAVLAELVDDLRTSGELAETLLVVTADHGEGFGERSRVRPAARIVGHGNGGAHEVLFHVPLIVSYPDRVGGVERSAPVSLTGFPEVVRSVLADRTDADPFVAASKTVVASSRGLDPGSAELAREHCGDVSPYDLPADARYEAGPGETVVKHVRWGDVTRTIRVRDPHTRWVDESAATDVGSVVDAMEQAGVRAGVEGEVSPDVKRRLDHLGYA